MSAARDSIAEIAFSALIYSSRRIEAVLPRGELKIELSRAARVIYID